MKPLDRVIVLGARGQLGGEFLRALGPAARGWDRAAGDLENHDALRRALLAAAPGCVINAAAFNQVDVAERRFQAALAANAVGPARLAEWSRAQGWRLLHFSTDYVFGGDRLRRPRHEADPPAPMNLYGYSKFLGEEAVLRGCPSAIVVRVAHLFGGESLSPGRASLPDRFAQLLRAGQPLRITRGQFLNPTSVRELVPACLQLLADGSQGLYHLAGDGGCTALDFARAVAEESGLPARIEIVAQDRRPAPRAAYTVLENRRWRREGRPPLPPWRTALRDHCAGRRS